MLKLFYCLLYSHNFCYRIIATSFNNDKTFQNVLNHSFESFINLSQRSPEFISLFMDDKLRKGLKGMTDNDIEGVLDKVMMLFRYLQEKDVFEKYYKQHLAKRLLSGRTVSTDQWVIFNGGFTVAARWHLKRSKNCLSRYMSCSTLLPRQRQLSASQKA